jgi:hypothetical protein
VTDDGGSDLCHFPKIFGKFRSGKASRFPKPRHENQSIRDYFDRHGALSHDR